MVLNAVWTPANPIGLKLPMNLYAFWPKNDWAMAGIALPDTLTEAEPIKAGLYAWVIYGALIVVHWSYYSDRWYYEYTMSKYGSVHLTTRTWYGTAILLRDLSKVTSWGITGLFWAVSLLPNPTSLKYF